MRLHLWTEGKTDSGFPPRLSRFTGRQRNAISSRVNLRVRSDRSINSRLQEIGESMRADLPPDHQPILAGSWEVNPGVDARIGGFLRQLREALKRALDAGEWRSARYGEAELVGSEEAGKHLGPGGAQNGMVG